MFIAACGNTRLQSTATIQYQDAASVPFNNRGIWGKVVPTPEQAFEASINGNGLFIATQGILHRTIKALLNLTDSGITARRAKFSITGSKLFMTDNGIFRCQTTGFIGPEPGRSRHSGWWTVH
jgi:hypothetical protein